MKWHYDSYSEGEKESLLALEMNLQQIGMPGLFFISGRIFACSRSSGSLWDFLTVKARRLLVPLGVGMVLFVFPASFIEAKHAECIADYSRNFGLGSIAHWFRCIGGFWWLWYLPALYTFMGLNFYLLKLTNSFQDSSRSTVVAGLSVVPPMGLALAITVGFGCHWTTPLFFLLPYVYCAFGAKRLIEYNEAFGISLLRFVFPIFLLPLAAVHGLSAHRMLDAGYSSKVVAVSLSTFYYSHFVATGFMETYAQSVRPEKMIPLPEEEDESDTGNADGENTEAGERRLKLRKWFWWAPLLGFFIPVIATAGPGPAGEVLYLWSYPPYLNSFNSFWYVLGTLNFGIWWMFGFASMLNQKFSDFVYKHLTESAMVIYVCHGLFASIASRLIVTPLSGKAPMLVALGAAVAFTFACSFLFYAVAITLRPCRILFGMRREVRRYRDVAVLPIAVSSKDNISEICL